MAICLLPLGGTKSKIDYEFEVKGKGVQLFMKSNINRTLARHTSNESDSDVKIDVN